MGDIANEGDSHVLTMKTVNPRAIAMENAVRGPIVTRAVALEKELAEAAQKPFSKVFKSPHTHRPNFDATTSTSYTTTNRKRKQAQQISDCVSNKRKPPEHTISNMSASNSLPETEGASSGQKGVDSDMLETGSVETNSSSCRRTFDMDIRKQKLLVMRHWISIALVALVMFTKGGVSANPRLTILNNQSHLECGTMQTVLTCQFQSQPAYSMHWSVDGTYISECFTHSCDRKDGMLSNYYTSVTAAGNVFKLYINPVDIFDNRTITCTDGFPSNDIKITTEQVKINKSLTTITNRTVGDNVVFDVTTNCVFHPNAVKLSLESKKGNGSGGFTAFQVSSSNRGTVCSNTKNPYCGGNKTSRTNFNFAISTDKNGGEMHQFKLHIIQTLDDRTNNTITFENDEIGQLKLPTQTSTTTTPSNEIWTMILIWVGALVAIIMVCIIIICCCRRLQLPFYARLKCNKASIV